jgi:hypothetical protein
MTGKKETVNGHIVRPWKHADNLVFHTISTVIWNLISWGIAFEIEGNIIVNQVSYDSIPAAVAAHPIIATIFLFPLIGSVMLYHCAAIWFNKSEFKIENGHFEIKRGPIPWGAIHIKIPIEDIKQAYVQQYISQSENDHHIYHYRLLIQRHSSADMILENRISLYADAKMLEDWIESRLMIKNVSVPGEVTPSEAA